jgi:glucosamine--fructose-6-phosphate aminotransferase (isomerizing)
MCGIIGYVGSRDVTPVLLAGLEKLEYRGYDSAGLSVLDGGGSARTRARRSRWRSARSPRWASATRDGRPTGA